MSLYIHWHILMWHFHRLEEIGAAAAKEYSLEKAMEKMKVEWKDMTFEFIAYRDSVSIKWQIIFNQTISCF